MLQFGNEWFPPPEQSERLREYYVCECLYDSKHREVFRDLEDRPEVVSYKYLINDYPTMISDIFADIIYGQPPVFTLPGAQSRIDKLVTDNELAVSLHEAEINCSYRGDMVHKVSLANIEWETRVVIEEYPAHSYYVERDPSNCRRVRSQALAWVVEYNEQRYLRVEHHYPGYVINQLFEFSGKRDKVRAVPVPLAVLYPELPEYQETLVPMPLLFHCPNIRTGNKYFGNSDYTPGLQSLFAEANERLTGISQVLRKHEEPILVTPEGVQDRRGNVRSSKMKTISVSPEEAALNVPRFVTWDAQLSAAFQQLEVLDGKILDKAGISPALLGRDKAGNIESSLAMKLRFSRLLSTCVRKQSYREAHIKRVLRAALALETAWLGLPVVDVLPEVVWRNGLPKDDKELGAVAIERFAAGLMSRHTAIRYSMEVGDAEAVAESERIDSEKVNQTQAQPALSNPV